jgi:hypothetical protein
VNRFSDNHPDKHAEMEIPNSACYAWGTEPALSVFGGRASETTSFLPKCSTPLNMSIAFWAASSESNSTNPNPLDLPNHGTDDGCSNDVACAAKYPSMRRIRIV